MFQTSAIMTSPFEDAKPVICAEKRFPRVDFASFEMSQSDVTPLKGLARWPRHIHCPECRQMSVTKITRKMGSGTQYVL